MDFLCICGHPHKRHQIDSGLDMYCNECWDIFSRQSNYGLIKFVYVYHKYQPDNLKYLELKYEENHK